MATFLVKSVWETIKISPTLPMVTGRPTLTSFMISVIQVLFVFSYILRPFKIVFSGCCVGPIVRR